jgi:hypothetical protein
MQAFRCRRRPLFRAALGRQHGAAAARRAAAAGEQALERRRVALVVDQRVVVVQLLALVDVAHGVDVDPAVFLEGFAVRLAGVVDPARVVAAAAAVDHVAVGEAEIEGVVDRPSPLGGAVGGVVPGDAFAAVFDDAFAGADGRRANTPLPWTGDFLTSYIFSFLPVSRMGSLRIRGRWVNEEDAYY